MKLAKTKDQFILDARRDLKRIEDAHRDFMPELALGDLAPRDRMQRLELQRQRVQARARLARLTDTLLSAEQRAIVENMVWHGATARSWASGSSTPASDGAGLELEDVSIAWLQAAYERQRQHIDICHDEPSVTSARMGAAALVRAIAYCKALQGAT